MCGAVPKVVSSAWTRHEVRLRSPSEAHRPFTQGSQDHAIDTAVLQRPSWEGHAARNLPVLAAVALASALALTATACGSSDTKADGQSTASASSSDTGDGKIKIPDDIRQKLKERGIDIDKWKGGAWKNWNKDDWLREADDYINPIIKGLWSSGRMRGADDPDKGVDTNDISGDQGVTDPTPAVVDAKAVSPTYHANAATAGKVFFDSPRARWSARRRSSRTRRTRASPTWSGRRAIACTPVRRAAGTATSRSCRPYNNSGRSAAQLETATRDQVAPYGVWWGGLGADLAAVDRPGRRDGRPGFVVRLRRDPCDAGEGQRGQVP